MRIDGTQTCAHCGDRDIPAAVWFWFEAGRPIHPWCDLTLWPRLDELARQRIRRLVRLCTDDPRAAQLASAAGGPR